MPVCYRKPTQRRLSPRVVSQKRTDVILIVIVILISPSCCPDANSSLKAHN
jgi:hypothetical protein